MVARTSVSPLIASQEASVAAKRDSLAVLILVSLGGRHPPGSHLAMEAVLRDLKGLSKFDIHPTSISFAMPDVGLFTATEPVPEDTKIVIRFSVEVGGLEVYNESYDVETLAAEVDKDQAKALELWDRRLLCVIAARKRRGFSSAVTRCIADGKCGDYGTDKTVVVDDLGPPA